MIEEIKKEFDRIFIDLILCDSNIKPNQEFFEVSGNTDKILWQFIEQKLTEAIKQAKIEENEYWEKKIFHPDSTMPGLSIMDFAVRINELKGDK